MSAYIRDKLFFFCHDVRMCSLLPFIWDNSYNSVTVTDPNRFPTLWTVLPGMLLRFLFFAVFNLFSSRTSSARFAVTTSRIPAGNSDHGAPSPHPWNVRSCSPDSSECHPYTAMAPIRILLASFVALSRISCACFGCNHNNFICLCICLLHDLMLADQLVRLDLRLRNDRICLCFGIR